MGAALFIVPEREIAGFDTFVNGKSLGGIDAEVLDKYCEAIGVTPLYSFCSIDPEDLAEMLEDAGEDVPDDLPDLQWFDASTGLTSVRALLGKLRAGEAPFANVEKIIEDLEEFERVLERLENERLRWYLSVDC
ncbi:MAG: hypothetical protein AAF184_11810 [Pseudomonadota bacterium]